MTVVEIHTPQGAVASAPTGASLTVRLDRDIDLARGDTLVHAADAANVTKSVRADLCWLDATPLQVGRRYLLKQGARTTQAIVREIEFVRDLDSFVMASGAERISANEIARVQIQVKEPILDDEYAAFRGTGALVLMDSDTNQTVAAGVIA